MNVKSLVHKSTADEVELAKEAAAHFAQHPALQIQAEIFSACRPWLTTARLFETFPVSTIMSRLEARPDIRQAMVSKLTGLIGPLARTLNPTEQSALIEKALSINVINLAEIETSFDAQTWAVYVFQEDFWKLFAEAVWQDVVFGCGEPEKVFVTLLIERFLAERIDANKRELKPILSHLDVAEAIDGIAWIQRIEPKLLDAANKARRAQERKHPKLAFSARQEMQIIGIKNIVAALDLTCFTPVIQAAGTAMGYGQRDILDDFPLPDGPSPPAALPKKPEVVVPVAITVPVPVAKPEPDSDGNRLTQRPPAKDAAADPMDAPAIVGPTDVIMDAPSGEIVILAEVDDDIEPNGSEDQAARELGSMVEGHASSETKPDEIVFDDNRSNHIPDYQFVAAGGTPVTDERTKDEIIKRLHDTYHVSFNPPESISDPMAEDLANLLIDGVYIEDQDRLKAALLVILPALDAGKYELNDQLKGAKTTVLYRRMYKELHERGFVELADRLSQAVSRTSPPPLPTSATPPKTSKRPFFET